MKRLIIVAFVSTSIAAVISADFADSASPRLLSESAIPAASRSTSSQVIRPISLLVSKPTEDTLPSLDQKQAEIRWAEIESWMSCAENLKCQIPHDRDPRDRHFMLREKILSSAQYFLDHAPTNPEQEARSYQAASRLLGFAEEQVQVLALKWIVSLPRAPGTVALLKDQLGDMVDPQLAQWTLIELRRHMSSEQEAEALDLVEGILFEGGIFASREVARSATILLHEGNRERFDRWVATLPPLSAKTRLLRESLDTGLKKGSI